MLSEFAGTAGFDIEASKDGSVFDGDLDSYDAFFFYTTGNLTESGTDKQPPMSKAGKQRLLDAVAAGKGFLGTHCASDTFHSQGKAFENQSQPDPYIAMLGGEFIRHGRQQSARMKAVDPKFPGMDKAGEGFDLNEEWYSLKNFASDMHVILVQETQGMKDADYDRPPYPATWARKHHDGRVFYTSMGHREDVWTNPIFQSLVVGALRWATGQAEADLTPNLDRVTPEASKLPKVG
jgi:type 1 glutamine amidotransferase